MCGRFFRLRPRDELAAAFRASATGIDVAPGYNIAPGQPILAVRYNAKSRERSLDALHWGLIPHFAKDRKVAFKCINARSETIDTLPSFRTAFEKRRCLIVADGFFEWRSRGKQKLPYAIARADHRPFAIAGLWENWKDPATGEWVRSCAVVTTSANALVTQIHDRMPVILDPSQYERWLGEEPAQAFELKQLLRPYPAEAMVMWPVSPRMNTPKVDDASVLDTFEDALPELPLGEGDIARSKPDE